MSAEFWIIMGKVFVWMLAAGVSGAMIGYTIAKNMDDDFGGEE